MLCSSHVTFLNFKEFRCAASDATRRQHVTRVINKHVLRRQREHTHTHTHQRHVDARQLSAAGLSLSLHGPATARQAGV